MASERAVEIHDVERLEAHCGKAHRLVGRIIVE
jgi:hypothetical protein